MLVVTERRRGVAAVAARRPSSRRTLSGLRASNEVRRVGQSGAAVRRFDQMRTGLNEPTLGGVCREQEGAAAARNHEKHGDVRGSPNLDGQVLWKSFARLRCHLGREIRILPELMGPPRRTTNEDAEQYQKPYSTRAHRTSHEEFQRRPPMRSLPRRISAALSLLGNLTVPASVFAQATSAPVATTIAARTAGMERRKGFIPIYLDSRQGRILLEPPRDSTRALLMITQAAGPSSNSIGIDRGASGPTDVVRFDRT